MRESCIPCIMVLAFKVFRLFLFPHYTIDTSSLPVHPVSGLLSKQDQLEAREKKALFDQALKPSPSQLALKKILPHMAAKDPITCHVLDTLTGRPAAGVKVSLVFDPFAGLELSPLVFAAITNSDGRITNWIAPEGRAITVDMVLEKAKEAGKTTVWKLKFYTGDYYGEGKTFWPEVDLIFYVNHGEHYHVPLLLGPYSYTTYRGS